VTVSGLPAAGAITLAADTALASGVATFVPTSSTTPVNATSTITVTSPVCGTSLTDLTFNGQGTAGALAGWPSGNTVDFGPVSCGGAAPAPQQVTLTNTSLTTDARITSVDISSIGTFTTDATAGEEIPAGGSLNIHFAAPAGPASSPTLSKVSATVVIHTDADSSAAGTSLTLTEEPQGAVLAFGTSTTSGCTTSANFGTFGSAGVLLQTGPSQNFCVVNTGNAPASVTLEASAQGSDLDAGAEAGVDASVEAGIDGGVASPFSLLVPSFSLPAAGSTPSVEQESLTFQPLHSGATVGSLAISANATTALCAPLPSPLSLSGSAIGGGPVVTPTALSFPATCGGAAPASQTFVVSNSSTAVDMNWTLSGPLGPGASQYTVTPDPAPGLLAPGASSTITVTAVAIPSPAVDPSLASLAAQVIITTDVPLDPAHVVTLSEEPQGDQLFVTAPGPIPNTLRFGQVPLATSVAQTLTITNNANPGSPAASVTATVSGTGAAAYTPATQVATPGAGASVGVPVTFNAVTSGPYPAAITFTTSDALCTPLPPPIVLSGTGTAGAVSLSATTLYFGTNPTATDVTQRGLVNCGSTGTPQTLTVSNSGSQAFNVTSVTLAEGASSPFTLSGATASTLVAINASAAVTITPSAIPSAVTNPNDTAAYSDVLTVTTDIPGDTGHTVQLVMQPFGAIISGTQPPTAWSFGTVGEGSIGTFQGTMIQNGGNAPATVTLQPISLPSVFGLQGNPVTVAPNGITALVGQFTPNLANGSWSGQGDLVVAASALCAPIPTAWMSPQITFTGTSSSSPVVTLSGNLVFPTTDCGDAPAAGQPVTLTNETNQAYTYTLKFVSGAHYTFADAGSGNLPAEGTVTIVVNPKAVTPGPGVLAGSAPYADDLIVTLATSPATTLTMPISWTLNGAVLSLPQGAGPFESSGSSVYIADSTSGFPLSIANTGTAAATVNFGIQPSGAFSLLPAPPLNVLPGIPALPELVSGPSAPACPTLASGSATFSYGGPVCQPLPASSVTVDSCSGTSSAQGCFLPTGDINCPTQTNTCVPTPNNTTSNCGTCGNGCSGSTSLCTASGSAPGGYACGAPPPPVPCTGGSAGAFTPAGCVPCLGNRNGGVCTTTEAAVLNFDIVVNGVTAATPTTKAGSCYYCMVAGECLDSAAKSSVNGVVTHDVTGAECGDTGSDSATQTSNDSSASASQCLDALQCVLTGGGTFSDPSTGATLTGGLGECTTGTAGAASTDPNASIGNCYCGANAGAACISAGPIGPCHTNIATDVSAYVGGATDYTDTLSDLTAQNLSPGGVGIQVLNCALTSNCNICFSGTATPGTP